MRFLHEAKDLVVSSHKFIMKIDKLFKRFMKENNIFGNSEVKGIMSYIAEFNEYLLPFNAFRWETTEQGHNYWYDKAMKWILYLYSNLEYIDEEEKVLYSLHSHVIKRTIFELLHFYCIGGSNQEDLVKIDSYNKLNDLYEELGGNVDKNQ